LKENDCEILTGRKSENLDRDLLDEYSNLPSRSALPNYRRSHLSLKFSFLEFGTRVSKASKTNYFWLFRLATVKLEMLKRLKKSERETSNSDGSFFDLQSCLGF